jgi:enoyl-CoA hydratase
MEGEMEYENLLVEMRGNVAVVTINRPDKLNALNNKTISEIGSFFKHAAGDDSIAAIVFTGAGKKSFVAGADIAEISTLNPTEAAHFARRGQRIFNKVERFPKPCIAAVNGFALGGGCELAMAFHFRVASENARFGQPEVKLGIIPGYGGTQRLPRIVGKGRALELLMTGDMIGAEEAYRIGLVNKVFPLLELVDKAVELANKCIANAPLALAYAICSVNQGMESPLNEALANEAHLFGLSVATDDFKEGTSAFLEKRKAEFKGC